MPDEHPSQGFDESDLPAELNTGSNGQSVAEPSGGITRRRFVTAAGVAALGLVAGCTALPGARDSSQPVHTTSAADTSASVVATPSVGVPAGWRPLATLSSVAVATDAHATRYPSLADADAFDGHPATRLVERALGGVSGAPAVEFLRSLVPAGGTVLIKPNWVEPSSWANGKITHPSVVIALARLAADAVGPTGRVIVGEGTSEGRDLLRILSATGFRAALKRLAPPAPQRAPIDIVDLNASSAGRLRVTLGQLSRFSAGDAVMYDAHGQSMGAMGEGRVGRYLIARPVVDADLIINVAKAKVHRSAGVTLALKNLVGIVPSADGPASDGRLKDIPHYSAEDVESGKQLVANQTIGRSAADLNALARYVARDGSLQRRSQRRMLCVVDGVVSGQRDQFNPDPVGTGFVVAGTDPVAVDRVAARCMGFDPARVESLRSAASGTLGLGTADPALARTVYDGAGQFSDYFSAHRRLEPVSVGAHWGDTMALRTFALGSSHVALTGGRLAVTTAASGLSARVVVGDHFAPLDRTGERAFEVAWPYSETQQATVVLMDKHFNLAEKTLTA